MRLLFDAHLPKRFARTLSQLGHDAIHTLDLAGGNRTTDDQVMEISVQEQRIIVTKDSDFVDSYWLERRPPQLLLISTGNISNVALEALLLPQLDTLEQLFATHSFIELSRTSIIIHE